MHSSRPHLVPTLAFLMALGCAMPALADGQSVLQSDRSALGMVSTAHPLATQAGLRMLEMGGNAADAAVAAAFAVAVVEPTMNSIGGRNQILLRTADGRVHGIDGTTQAPWDYDPVTAPRAAFGYGVIGIPGTVAGLFRLHEAHGSLSLAEVMEPAIDYARGGYRVLPEAARRMASAADQALQFPGTAAAYYRGDGSPYHAGDVLVQPEYARTLERLVTGGADAFYRGDIARAMAADFAANGAPVDLEDLAQYRAEDSRIVVGSYRGYEILGSDVPSAGVLTIQALNIMERFDPGSMSEPEWFAIVGQALGLARGELAGLGTDSAAARATSKDYAQQLAETIGAPGRPRPTAGQPERPLPPEWTTPEHTTHLSVSDADGMVVSLTQTLGPNMGSKVVTPGLGFLYASTLGGYLSTLSEPGERARSNICPLIVLKDGEVVLVLGAAGGGMIPPAVVHAITRVIDFGMELPHALAEPRAVGNGAGVLNVETSAGIGWTPEDLDVMRAMGLEIRETPRSGAFGRVHGLQYDAASGEWIGAADPDWEGVARGPAVINRR